MRRGSDLAALLAAALALVVSSCAKEATSLHLEGKTMGTTWHATVVSDKETTEDLTSLVQSRLDELEGMFTNWQDTSAVSQFNASTSTGWQPVSQELAEVVAYAQMLSQETQGAFDITASPLIDLWGFGAKGRTENLPDDATVAATKARCGWQKLQVQQEPPMLRKIDDSLQINVSALAEGYAIDDIVRRLRSRSIDNFLLEVGGELYASGAKADGTRWHVGVQQPDEDKGKLASAMPLQNEALATSGTYRQHREYGALSVSHILDARTGRPVNHSLVSVSVTAPSCLTADGWATALLVLGGEEARLLAQQKGLAVFFMESKQ